MFYMLSLLALLQLGAARVTDISSEYAQEWLDYYKVSNILYDDVSASISLATDHIDDNTHEFVTNYVLTMVDAVLVESHNTSVGPQWHGQGVGKVTPLQYLDRTEDDGSVYTYFITPNKAVGAGRPVQDFSCSSGYTPKPNTCDSIQESKVNLKNTGDAPAFFSLYNGDSCGGSADGFWVRSRAVSCIDAEGYNSVRTY